MLNHQKDPLFILIKSLSKSEKRQFKLFVGRLEGNTNSKFIALFNHIDKHDNFDEKIILKKDIVSKLQLSNLKANLYKQILKSLRLSFANQNIRVALREQLDYATILYDKGLSKQSLKILDKAKAIAIKNGEKNIAYEIVELEKVIESQYITRSTENRADELAIQAKELSSQNVIASKLSNLSLQLYGLLLKVGYVKNKKDYDEVYTYFHDRLPKYDSHELGFREKLWLYKAYLWYSFLIQDFLSCYKYARKWVDLFESNPNMIKTNPVFYLKGVHYLLESLFYIRHQTKFNETLNLLEQNINTKLILQNDNTKVLGFIYLYTNKLNVHFLSGNFKEGLSLVTEIEAQISFHKNRIDQHHIMLFYYKIACMYFGVDDYKSCIKYLTKIISTKNISIREDLMCFARILNLVAHFDAGLDENLDFQIKDTYRFLLKMNDLHAIQKEMLKFLREVVDLYPHQIKSAFKKLHASLLKYEDHPYEKRAFLYLDILSWLESKFKNESIANIIQNKARKLLR
ncbi:MAG: hypothetical protein HRT69_08665 [Flavobacteriaceae bacterium]|nr:hypothetical protein [Flavobacteriaceae bacterium]